MKRVFLGLIAVSLCVACSPAPAPTAVPATEVAEAPTETAPPPTERAVSPTAAAVEPTEPVESPTLPPAPTIEIVEPLFAVIDVRFIESAPKDTFQFENIGSCVIEEVTITIDLSGSAGGLIFDTTGSGAGVEVFQPFEVAEGRLELISSEQVIDGDTALTIRVTDLAPGSRVGFTIDVDDTLQNSDLGNIQVTGAEIEGGLVQVVDSTAQSAESIFGGDSRAELNLMCGADA